MTISAHNSNPWLEKGSAAIATFFIATLCASRALRELKSYTITYRSLTAAYLLHCRKASTLQARSPDTGCTPLVPCTKAPPVVRLSGHHHRPGHHWDNRYAIITVPLYLLTGVCEFVRNAFHPWCCIFAPAAYLQYWCLRRALWQRRLQRAIPRWRLHAFPAQKGHHNCMGRPFCGILYLVRLLQCSRTDPFGKAAVQPFPHRQPASQLAGKSHFSPTCIATLLL